MQRIVDGILYEGNRLENAWDVSIWESRGHREVSARQVVEWSELGPVPPLKELDSVEDAEFIEEQHQRALKKAAQRAQTMCRRIIKAEGFDELLTITYRENQTDRAECKKHFKEWVRRMKRALGGLVDVVDQVTGEISKKWKDGNFRYCASFERQDRGAMHVHVACFKLPKHAVHKGVKIEGWRLGTDVWRGIVDYEAEGPSRSSDKRPMVVNGLVFVGGKSKWSKKRRKNMSAAKMASYVSKYIMKDYAESPMGANRYSRSNAIEVAKPVHVRLCGASLADAIGAMFECKDGDVVVSHRLGTFKDSYWLCTEPEKPDPRKLH